MKPDILIIGAGSIGRRHARNLLAIGGYGISIYDTDLPLAEALAEEVSGRSFHRLGEALEYKSAGVMICSPPDSHVAHALLATESGANVFVEKPIATSTSPELDQLILMSERLESPIMVGHNLRFNRCIRRAQNLVSSNEIGDLLSVEAVFGQYLPEWRPETDYRSGYITRSHTEGGGIIHDVATHEIDYLTWIAGEVDAVACVAAQSSDLEMAAEDTAEITLSFSSGILGRVHVDCTRRSYTRRFELIGTRGTLNWDYHIGLTRTEPGSSERMQIEPPADPDEAYVLELERFIALIEDGVQPEVDSKTAKRVLELVEAAQASTNLNGVGIEV